jgi:hypothetical protein
VIASLVLTSWRLVRRSTLLVLVAAALLLTGAAVPALDGGHAVTVLRGVGVILACAWALTMDDPAGEVLAASPYPRAVRSLVRLLCGLPLVVGAWLVAAVVVEWRAPYVPVLGLGVEALALGVAGLAIAAGLRAWRDHLRPGSFAAVGLLALAMTTAALPREYGMDRRQTWGAPFEAAQVRWTALLLLAVGVLMLALSDPLSARRRARIRQVPATGGDTGPSCGLGRASSDVGQEVQEEGVDPVGCLELHPVSDVVEPLVAPRTDHVRLGAGHGLLGERHVARAPHAQRGRLDRW